MSRLWMIVPVVAVCAMFTARGLVADEPKPADAPKKPTKDEVKKLMIAVHRGEKSPMGRTVAELKKDAPDWEQLGKDAKEFAKMAEVLKTGASPYTDSTHYISSATDLNKAVGEKDGKKAATAFAALNKSCTACHYGKPN